MKSAAGLLRSLVRTGTRQGKSVNKLMTALFKAATPAAPKRKRAPAAKVVKPKVAKAATVAVKPVKVAPVRAAAPRAPTAKPRVAVPAPHTPPAPGKWLASHYAMPAGVGQALAESVGVDVALMPHRSCGKRGGERKRMGFSG